MNKIDKLSKFEKYSEIELIALGPNPSIKTNISSFFEFLIKLLIFKNSLASNLEVVSPTNLIPKEKINFSKSIFLDLL